VFKEFNRLANLWNWNLNRCETLLAVSGGADSVVMARFFKQLNYPFAIAHVNYGLRGEDSLRDQQLVEELARELGVECFVHNSSAEALALSQGISLQMSARHIRYAFFETIRAQFPGRFAKIATAHHGNDNLEHFFLYLYRGNQRIAWRGIPVENGAIIRPLLGYSKEEIYAIATENGWAWREDGSNQKPAYLRNKIRHWIIPMLQDAGVCPSADSLQNAEGLGEGEGFQADTGALQPIDFVKMFYVLSIRQQRLLVDNQPKLSAEWDRWVETDIEKGSIWIPEKVGNFNWLGDVEMKNFATQRLLNSGFTSDQIGRILRFSVQIGGKIIGKEYTACRNRTGWMLFKKLPVFVGGKLEISKVSVQEFTRWKAECGIERSRTTVFVSTSVEGLDLLVGSRATGNYFLGVRGKKTLLSDVFIDVKIENYLKDTYPVISTDMGEVIAVLGLKIGEKYRVQHEDSYCFRLDFIQN
jgi:tRNA(Ile)-lysidine synthetase-like protein